MTWTFISINSLNLLTGKIFPYLSSTILLVFYNVHCRSLFIFLLSFLVCLHMCVIVLVSKVASWPSPHVFPWITMSVTTIFVDGCHLVISKDWIPLNLVNLLLGIEELRALNADFVSFPQFTHQF